MSRDFPGGPVGKTQCCQCRGPVFPIPGRGTRSRMRAAAEHPCATTLHCGTTEKAVKIIYL